MKNSIKTRLFIFFILLSLVPTMIMGGVGYYFIRAEISNHAQNTGTNTDEAIYNIVDTSVVLSDMLIFIVTITVLISVIAAYIISKEFFRPVNEIMNSMKQAKKGDLSARFDGSGYNEFQFLSSSFNTMLYTFSILIGRIKGSSEELKGASNSLLTDLQRSQDSIDAIERQVEILRGHQNEMSAENIIFLRDEIEKRVAGSELYLKKQGIKKIGNRIEYNKHINNLFVEVQKLKLLLENIESSADRLDGIAVSLDRQVNTFTIENNPYDDIYK